MALDYLAKLNSAQREAVEHGAAALLVIAGAGKTKTLAHRVAHLILCGVHLHRILLLTFSRRAALEMTRCAERIVAAASPLWAVLDLVRHLPCRRRPTYSRARA